MEFWYYPSHSIKHYLFLLNEARYTIRVRGQRMGSKTTGQRLHWARECGCLIIRGSTLKQEVRTIVIECDFASPFFVFGFIIISTRILS